MDTNILATSKYSSIILAVLILSFSAVITHNTHAQEQDSKGAAWQVANTLGRAIVETAKKENQTQQQFSKDVSVLLQQVINFDVFAKNVMGKYGTDDYMEALGKKERAAYKKSTKRFSVIFRQQLIGVYSSTFWSIAKKAKITTLPATAKKKLDQQIIRQKISGVSDKPLIILYKMVLIDDAWQIKNLAVRGVDIGKIYRQQFYNLMAQHQDINKVIAAWKVSTV